MRLIDADALLEILEDKTHKLYEFEQGVLKRTGMRSQEHVNAYRELCHFAFFEGMVENQPTVEERPTGEWLRMSSLSEQEDDRYKCSHCGNVVHYKDKMNLYTFNRWCGRCGSDNERRRI